ncbi:beta-carotene ketolase CrtW [Pantanalinema sp. GBBB05]|uniref:beta-carotene ketolase CrtW n=1 Tax=Pantanalinema sp. GBBB05 TaxID=2604139 RepID=UPI001D540163|nr:beta-carotene ketolase [Pantanalinema sp. GBBB05]
MPSSNHTLLDPSPLKFVVIEKKLNVSISGISGLLIAILIISLWAISFTYLLTVNIAELPIWSIPLLMVWQGFLFTGLFITAHDAMHGSVLPQNPKINHLVGSITVFAYALFSYKDLLQKHWSHHRYPASEFDPDFHDGSHPHPIAWYVHFMKGYWNWRQWIGFTVLYPLVKLAFHTSHLNLILFWILPLVLSSIQLFYFGTFLTHREPAAGYTTPHRAKTNPLPTVWSFITCYHFGYHEEHHECPYVPWWKLPAIYQSRFTS